MQLNVSHWPQHPHRRAEIRCHSRRRQLGHLRQSVWPPRPISVADSLQIKLEISEQQLTAHGAWLPEAAMAADGLTGGFPLDVEAHADSITPCLSHECFGRVIETNTERL